jgi:hypothetical protein
MLEHPGIVPIYTLGTYSDGRPYYAMRLIRGETLRDAINTYHGSPKKANPGLEGLALRRLLGQFVAACNAVAYAHSRRVIHRDLKPSNIMLGEFGQTLVVDWGLAKILSSQEQSDLSPVNTAATMDAETTVPGAALGTLAYMSPEQATGQVDKVGLASDIYSLGATLYTILTGRPPFDGSDRVELVCQAQRGDFPRPRAVNPGCPAALEAICLKAMAYTPSDRYASCSDLATDVERWLADEAVSAWREPSTIRARRWVSRHRATTAVLSGGVLLAALMGSVFSVVLAGSYRREADARQEAELRNQQVEKLLRETWQKQQEAIRHQKRAYQEHERAERARLRAEEGRRGALAALATIEHLTDALSPPEASDAAFRDTVDKVFDLLPAFPYKEAARKRIKDNQAMKKWFLNRSAPIRVKQAARFVSVAQKLRSEGHFSTSIRLSSRVIAGLSDTVTRHPDTTALNSTLSAAHQARATAHESLRQYDDALRDWDHAARYADKKAAPTLQLDRALCLMRNGQVSPALEEAKKWTAETPRGKEDALKLARLYALAGSEGKAEQADASAQQAVEWLKQAIKDGHLTSQAARKLVQDDSDFRALRDRPGLLKSL